MGQFERIKAENIMRHSSSGVYYLNAKVGGKVFRRSLKTDNLRLAKIKRDDMLIDLRARSGSIGTRKQPPNLKEACAVVERYYSELPSYKAKPSSMAYRKQLIDLMAKTLPSRAVSSWTREEVKKWWSSPEVVRYSTQRRNNLLGTFRQMMKIMIEHGHRASDPSEPLTRLTVRKSKIEVPSSAEFRAIVESISKQNRVSSIESARYVEFLAYSGCRHGEAQAVKWSDINKDTITITGGELGTKNHESRVIPIIPPMRELLGQMSGKGKAGVLFSIRSPRAALNNACDRLGLSRMRLHDLRHLFATVCIESGVDIPTVSRWLGHKDGGALAMKVYGHIRDDHSQRQAAKVDF